MSTIIGNQLEDVRRRIARLEALSRSGLVSDRTRVARHLDALRHAEASVVTAANRSHEEAEERFGRLMTRLAVAERSVAADVSDEWTAYANAVEDELRSWDTYLERLQATAVANAWEGRDRAENALADVRTKRIAVYGVLDQARKDVNGAWHEQRNNVNTARAELEQKADELSANLN